MDTTASNRMTRSVTTIRTGIHNDTCTALVQVNRSIQTRSFVRRTIYFDGLCKLCNREIVIAYRSARIHRIVRLPNRPTPLK